MDSLYETNIALSIGTIADDTIEEFNMYTQKLSAISLI